MARIPNAADVIAILVSIFSLTIGVWFTIGPFAGSVEFSWVTALMGLLMLWFGSNTIIESVRWLKMFPGSALQLFDEHITIDKTYVPYSDISSVGWRLIVLDKRMNFAKAGQDHAIFTTIVTKSGTEFKLGDGQGGATWFGPSLGQEQSITLLNKMQKVDRLTVTSRIAAFQQEFLTTGAFTYDKKRLEKGGLVVVDQVKIPLKEFLISQSDPFCLYHQAKINPLFKLWSVLFFAVGRTEISLINDRAAFLTFVQAVFGIRWQSLTS